MYGVLDFCVFLLAVTGGKMAIRAIPGRPIAKSTIHGLPYLSLVILFSIDASASHQPGIAPELTPKLRWVAFRFRHGSVVPESWPVIINPLFHLFLFFFFFFNSCNPRTTQKQQCLLTGPTPSSPPPTPSSFPPSETRSTAPLPRARLSARMLRPRFRSWAVRPT